MNLTDLRAAGILLSMFLCMGSCFSPSTNACSSRTGQAFRIPAREIPHARTNPITIEALNAGDFAAGSISAPLVDPKAAGDCVLGDTQYRIEYPGGARKLVIEASASSDVDVYVRRGSPITVEQGTILADFKSETPRSTERLSVPDFAHSNPVERGTYFIAVSNCGPGPADYAVMWKTEEPSADATIDLAVHGVELGSVESPEPGSCRLGRSQYFAPVFLDSCGDAFSWTLNIHADQPLNVYLRKNAPVTVENGLVIYDKFIQSQARVQNVDLFLDSPGGAILFVALENCGHEPAIYTIRSIAGVDDGFPPFITSVALIGKHLNVTGVFLTGGTVLLDDEPQPTVIGEPTRDFKDTLIVKRARNKIARHQTVVITVKRGGACVSPPFLFNRP